MLNLGRADDFLAEVPGTILRGLQIRAPAAYQEREILSHAASASRPGFPPGSNSTSRSISLREPAVAPCMEPEEREPSDRV